MGNSEGSGAGNEAAARMRSLGRLVGDEAWANARERLDLPSFQGCLRALRRTVRDLRAQNLRPCDEQAGWYHDFYCSEHGHALVFDASSPTTHRCPAGGGHFVAGPKPNAAWRWFINDRLSRSAYSSALLWTLTGEEEARLQARETLVEYASRYLRYPTNPAPRGGKATVQSLDEAVWLIPLLWCYALIRESLAPDDIKAVEHQLLIPARELIAAKVSERTHNIECWHHAALLTAGHVLGREDWLQEATRSVLEQLESGVLEDGLWFEGSPSYHYYATWALSWAARLSKKVRTHPKLARMFRAPLALAFPDGTFPAFNDCWAQSSLRDELVHGAPLVESFYELAAGWFGDPAFEQLLADVYKRRPRDNIEALLHGPHLTREAHRETPAAKSRVFPSAGYAVLGSGATPDDSVQLVLKYGPHGGQHGHMDKLSLVVWACGHPISRDLGTSGYGDAEGTRWHRSTLAHNTVVVDGQTQPPTTGSLSAFRPVANDQFGVVDATVQWSEAEYAGVILRRVVLQRDHTIIDIVDCRADAPRRFELAQRFCGELAAAPDHAEHVELGGMLRNGRRIDGGCRSVGITPASSLRTDYHFLEPASERFLAEAPANPRTVFEPLVIRRITDRRARFISIIDIHRQATKGIRADLRRSDEGQVILDIERAGRKETWSLSLESRLEAAIETEPVRVTFSNEDSLVVYLPAGHDDKSYVGLLRHALQRIGVEVGNLPRILKPEWLAENAGPGRVLHFHTPAYDYSKGASNRDEVLRRLREWEAGVQQANAMGYRAVWTAHNLYPHDAIDRDIHQRGRMALLQQVSAVIVHCTKALDEIRRAFGSTREATLIAHPNYRESYGHPWPKAEARRKLGLPLDALVYLNLGMIRRYKGQDRLINAFSKLDDPKARLVVAGQTGGSFGESLEELTHSLQAAAARDSRIILYPDHVSDPLIPVYYGACDIAVFSYRQILTSGALVLAQSMERPVVAPNLGCIGEAVNADAGILYEPNSDDALEAALRQARDLSPLAGKNAWESVSRLDWDSAAIATREVYRQAVNRPAR